MYHVTNLKEEIRKGDSRTGRDRIGPDGTGQQKPRNPEIPKNSKNPEIQKSQEPKIQKSKKYSNLKIQKSE